jgi:ABC-type amino acid transport system permease subunit
MEFGLLIAALSLNTSAYIAEILRSGIRAVAPQHHDAGRTLGLSPRRIRIFITYPQAIRIALPALGTRLIHNMKNSTIALVLPISVDRMELLGQAGRIAGQTFAWAEPLIFAAAAHLTLAVLLGLVVNKLATVAQYKVEAGS